MRIVLDNVSKSFVDKTIFSNVNMVLKEGDKVAILGSNGSGKSTLLGVIIGLIEPTKGSVKLTLQGKEIGPEEWYKYISFSGPYMTLYEEFNVIELIQFHFSLKECLIQESSEKIASILLFNEKQFETPFKYFSSGMKQRLKLGLALLSKSNLVLLDEPLTNLDDKGRELYQSLLQRYLGERTLVIASNLPEEYAICDKSLVLSSH